MRIICSGWVKENFSRVQCRGQLIVRLKAIKYIKGFFSSLSPYIICQTFSIIYASNVMVPFCTSCIIVTFRTCCLNHIPSLLHHSYPVYYLIFCNHYTIADFELKSLYKILEPGLYLTYLESVGNILVIHNVIYIP